MKFMKLGSKPDAFHSDGTSIRYVSSELVADVTITVGEVKFYLHKFPLLSKSSRLRKLILKADEDDSDEVELVGFPGGPKAFDICAKFCYGMTVTLNPYNVAAARCAAEYLGMSEDVDRGNLVYKIEVFLNSSIFRTWKDSIIVLQTTRSLLPWSEDLNIVGRCVDSIASKTSVDPGKVMWSYTYNRKLAMAGDGIVEQESIESVSRDWWVEDICELGIDTYKRVGVAIRSKGRMDGALILEALRTYAVRWLPDSLESLVSSEDHVQKNNKALVETLVSLLPSDKTHLGRFCSFLLKLLKVAVFVGVDDSAREDLVRKISMVLDKAVLKDLLIPARQPQNTIYDVELVQCIVKRFATQSSTSGWDIDMDSCEKIEKGDDVSLVIGHHGSWLNVGGLVDAYLAEIASDPNLPVSSFVQLSRMVPEPARPIHDGLYRAIDIYLKEHPELTKPEKKQLCGLMDVKKLTVDASMHAAQNERLPLRLVVQVLYFEQIRASTGTTITSQTTSTSIQNHHDDDDEQEWDRRTLESSKSLHRELNKLKIHESSDKLLMTKNNSKLGTSRSRRIFDKLWGKANNAAESKSSETSGSSQSPTASLVPGDSSSSSRQRRHSIS